MQVCLVDRSEIDSNHVIERYLAGQLSDGETEAFEIYCLENPEVADDLEYVRALKAGLRDSEVTLEPDRADDGSWLRSPAYAIAASVVAAVGLAGTAFFASKPGPDYPTGGVLAGEFVLERMRSSDLLEFDIGDGTGTMLLHIDVGPNPLPPYRVSISRGGENSISLAGVVPIGDTSELTIWLTDPTPGDYEIAVTDADGEEHVYSTRLVASE